MKTDQTYKITPGPDGILWVSLQPLLRDLRIERAKCELEGNYIAAQKVDVVIAFIDALISEGNYDLYKDEVLQ